MKNATQYTVQMMHVRLEQNIENSLSMTQVVRKIKFFLLLWMVECFKAASSSLWLLQREKLQVPKT